MKTLEAFQNSIGMTAAMAFDRDQHGGRELPWFDALDRPGRRRWARIILSLVAEHDLTIDAPLRQWLRETAGEGVAR